MNAPDYGDRHGAPRPPRHIEADMEAAGAAGDDVALGIAKAKYRAWLEGQGIHDGQHGSEAPKEAFDA